MPPIYVIGHIVASLLCFFAVVRAPKTAVWTISIALVAISIVGLGFLVERRADWAWQIMSWSVTDMVFYTTIAPPMTCGICGMGMRWD